jgi:hypothetical protein
MYDKLQSSLLAYVIMMAIGFAILAFSIAGCTYSINMVHTQGKADDVIDETSSATPNTDITLPISKI